MKFIFTVIILILTTSCNTLVGMQNQTFSYLALGDSYTIGEAVDEKDKWPAQLVERLKEDDIKVLAPRIIAQTGWTTDDLLGAIEKASIQESYDMVSLLIGVNNQYRGYPIDQYKKEFEKLLTLAVQFAGDNAQGVFVVSIPDYGVTPFVKEKGGDPVNIASELDEYNKIAKEICETRGVSFTSITAGSKMAKEDETLVAKDGLHPSGKMYTQWVDRIYQVVFDGLSSR